MSDAGTLYCDQCGRSLAFSWYDARYSELTTHPPFEALPDQVERRVEAAVIACACGGRYRFDAPLRCPHCRVPLDASVLHKDRRWQYRIEPALDGSTGDAIWREADLPTPQVESGECVPEE